MCPCPGTANAQCTRRRSAQQATDAVCWMPRSAHEGQTRRIQELKGQRLPRARRAATKITRKPGKLGKPPPVPYERCSTAGVTDSESKTCRTKQIGPIQMEFSPSARARSAHTGQVVPQRVRLHDLGWPVAPTVLMRIHARPHLLRGCYVRATQAFPHRGQWANIAWALLPLSALVDWLGFAPRHIVCPQSRLGDCVGGEGRRSRRCPCSAQVAFPWT